MLADQRAAIVTAVRAQPIPSCISPERPLKYEVVTAGDYVQSRFQSTYNH